MHWKNWLIQKIVRLLKPSSPHRGAQRRFLILSTTGLGDTLWGIPAINALRAQYPDCYIGVLTSPVGREILEGNVDELFVVKDPVLKQLPGLFVKLRRKQFTDVLSFHTSQRPILPLAAMMGAERIVGTKGLNKGLDFLLTDALEPRFCHEIERRMEMARAVGATSNSYAMHFSIGQEDEGAVQGLLDERPLVGFHPGAKDAFKQWPPEHFIALGKRLQKEFNCRICVTGTPGERALVTGIAKQIEGAVAVTSLSLKQSAALIKRMRLMVANDTGPMHVAFAMGTPTVALFGPTQPELCGPYFVEKCIVVATKKTCSPCLRKKCAEPFCLLQIGVDEVYDAAIKLF